MQRPSSRRAALSREPSPGTRIGRPSLRGMNTAAARQIPIGSRAGPRNSSRKTPDRLIGIDKPPRAGATVREWSGRRDSNPRPQPWQGCALPLSYTRIRLGSRYFPVLSILQKSLAFATGDRRPIAASDRYIIPPSDASPRPDPGAREFHASEPCRPIRFSRSAGG